MRPPTRGAACIFVPPPPVTYADCSISSKSRTAAPRPPKPRGQGQTLLSLQSQRQTQSRPPCYESPPRGLDSMDARTHTEKKRSNTSSSSSSSSSSSWASTGRFLLQSACGGAIAEVIVNLALYPLDTLKVRAQYHFNPLSHIRPKPSTNASAWVCPRALAQRTQQHFISNGFSLPLRTHITRFLPHVQRAFAGVGAGILASAFDAFVFTLVYEGVRVIHARRFGNEKKRHTALADFCAGGIASLASAAVDAPFAMARDRIRLGLQPGMVAAWTAATRTGAGWKAMYVGAVPTLVRDVPAEAIEFSAYDGLKRLLFSSRDVQPGAAARLSLGAVAGVLMGVVCTPLDLAVTRIVAMPSAYRNGVFGTLAKVAREEGARATFRALPHRAFREAFSSALFFAIYDGLKGVDGDVEGD